ncbi:MAG: N-acetylmuramoyl-L-alanine amidase [Nitrosomonas sp.]|nr:MAG: N-acetylmuramoyl-L-alanine amidase [Nitrosomonas sp.]
MNISLIHHQPVAIGYCAYFLLLLCLSVVFGLFSFNVSAANETIKTARIGLTPDFTRITLESNRPLDYELSMLDNPYRIVIDLNNTQVTPVLASLSQQIDAIDPFVQRVRVGQFKSHVTRLVFDLKANVVPRTFVIAPKDNYGYRLVLDVQHPGKVLPAAPQTQPDIIVDRDFAVDSLDQLVASLSQTVPQKTAIQPAAVPLPLSKPQSSQTNRVDTAIAVSSIKNSKVPRILIVAIDPGHGGKDPGAVGNQGTYEKDITLAIAKKLKTRIDQESNMRAVLTRTGDYYVSLPQRRVNARKANADLFISIHADANPKAHAHGSSVFTLSEHGATSTTASWLANKENSVDDLMGGIDIAEKSRDIKELLIDLSFNATINDSAKLAEYILKQLSGINHLHKRNVEQAGFAVLKSPDIPSILVETAFLSNPKEEVKLRSTGYQDKMADAMFLGIKKYFADNPALARADVARVK